MKNNEDNLSVHRVLKYTCQMTERFSFLRNESVGAFIFADPTDNDKVQCGICTFDLSDPGKIRNYNFPFPIDNKIMDSDFTLKVLSETRALILVWIRALETVAGHRVPGGYAKVFELDLMTGDWTSRLPTTNNLPVFVFTSSQLSTVGAGTAYIVVTETVSRSTKEVTKLQGQIGARGTKDFAITLTSSEAAL